MKSGTDGMIHRRIELSTHGIGSLGNHQGMRVIQHVGCDCSLCKDERARISSPRETNIRCKVYWQNPHEK